MPELHELYVCSICGHESPRNLSETGIKLTRNGVVATVTVDKDKVPSLCKYCLMDCICGGVEV
ncbi:MAG: hypothetical protein KGH62_02025 [Candidatus Micrarchaeota archaeon]|nr:hypothetical protein [Candidatus Micrarchaeota archaeon]